MTAVTVDEFSMEDAPLSLKEGTGRRRVRMLIRTTTGSTGDTLDLSNHAANLTAIEGVKMHSVAGSVRTTYPTWSGTTLTFAGHTGNGETIVEVLGYLS